VSRLDYLETDDEGFRAVATPLQEIRDGFMSWSLDQPLDFGMFWRDLRLCGKAICMNMLTDHFFTDPALVVEVKAAAQRRASPAEIRAILDPSSSER
jgi:hypothetical protein